MSTPEPDSPTAELNVAFGPRQILGGFVLLAALILLLLRLVRRRRGDRSPER